MKLFSSIALTVLLALGSQQALAQTKKSKAKSKTSSSKSVKKAAEEAPAKTEAVTPESTETAPLVPETPAATPAASTEFSNPTTPEATPPAAAPTANEPTSMRGGSHLFGLHAALGVPHPLRVGLTYVHPSQLFSFEANYGTFSIGVDGASAKMNNMELGLRWHPFLGSFYVGALLGNRMISVEKKEVISAQDIAMKAEIKSNYLAPNLGWIWGADDGGFFASMDLGLIMPSGVSSSFSSNADGAVQATAEYQQLDKDVRDIGKKIGETSLPMWTLVKLGWLF